MGLLNNQVLLALPELIINNLKPYLELHMHLDLTYPMSLMLWLNLRPFQLLQVQQQLL
jgi:hypothetical protein